MTLLLRSISHTDIQALRKIRNLPEVANFMYDNTYITEEMQEKWFEKITKDSSQIHLTAILNEEVIGSVSFKKVDTEKPEWGFYINPTITQSHYGVGGVVEFLSLDFWFKEHKELNCEVMSKNVAVIKLHQKFGFMQVGDTIKNNHYIYISSIQSKLSTYKASNGGKNEQNITQNMQIISGFGSAVMLTAIDFWFENHNILYAEVLAENKKSIYLHNKFGFVEYERKNDIVYFKKYL